MVDMTDLDALLERHHVAGLTGGELLSAIDQALGEVPSIEQPLTAAELAVLRESGGDEAVAALAEWNPHRVYRDRILEATRSVTRILAESMTVRDAADLLGLDRSRVFRRISGGTLWSFMLDGVIRIPSWQFLDRTPLPGLAAIVSAIPPGQSPASVSSLMVTPQDDLDGASPVEYLATGADPIPIAEMLADLGRW